VFKNPTIDFNALFNSLGNSTCSSPEVVLVFLLYEGSTIHNASDQFVSCVYFLLCRLRFSSIPLRQKSDLYAPISNSCIFTPIENWTHVYMNLFTRNSPYYHLLNYLLFFLKHPVYAYEPVPMAARSKACVCGRSFAGIVCSNDAGRQGYLLLVSVVCSLFGELITRPE